MPPTPLPNPSGCCNGGACCSGVIPTDRPLTVQMSTPGACCDGQTMTIESTGTNSWEGTGSIGGCTTQPDFKMTCFTDGSGDHWQAQCFSACTIPLDDSLSFHCDDAGGSIIFRYNLPPSPIVFVFTVTWKNT